MKQVIVNDQADYADDYVVTIGHPGNPLVFTTGTREECVNAAEFMASMAMNYLEVHVRPRTTADPVGCPAPLGMGGYREPSMSWYDGPKQFEVWEFDDGATGRFSWGFAPGAPCWGPDQRHELGETVLAARSEDPPFRVVWAPWDDHGRAPVRKLRDTDSRPGEVPR